MALRSPMPVPPTTALLGAPLGYFEGTLNFWPPQNAKIRKSNSTKQDFNCKGNKGACMSVLGSEAIFRMNLTPDLNTGTKERQSRSLQEKQSQVLAPCPPLVLVAAP